MKHTYTQRMQIKAAVRERGEPGTPPPRKPRGPRPKKGGGK
jgi:hypothetical protein